MSLQPCNVLLKSFAGPVVHTYDVERTAWASTGLHIHCSHADTAALILKHS